MRHAKWLCWLSALAVGLLATRGQTQDKKDDKPKARHQRWAILIGVDDYAQAQDLQYCGADQRAFRERLIKSGFDEDNVFLLHDDAKEKKYLPFKANIEKQLDLVLGLLEKDDIIVLAFSGHGLHFGGKSYICPTDAKLDDPNSLVSMDSVYDRLKKSPTAFKLVVVDACRNDPRPGGQRSLTPTDGTRQFAQTLERPPEGLVLLNSCAPGEISWEEKDFGHGVFMHFLMDGLSGQADENGDGKVSLSELSQYAGRKTKLHVAKKFNDSQRPFLKGDLTLEALDFDFGRTVAKVSTTPNNPSSLPKPSPFVPKTTPSLPTNAATLDKQSDSPPILRREMKSLTSNRVDFTTYKGKVLLIVNVASKCGHTHQYMQLEQLHEKYATQGLAVLGFPCNQFGNQEPGTEAEIGDFCRRNYDVKFDLFSKVDVNGDSAVDLYKYLTSHAKDAGPVKWNFEKFLISKKGQVVTRFRSAVRPDSDEVVRAIEAELAK